MPRRSTWGSGVGSTVMEMSGGMLLTHLVGIRARAGAGSIVHSMAPGIDGSVLEPFLLMFAPRRRRPTRRSLGSERPTRQSH